jgi:hypothetical protein
MEIDIKMVESKKVISIKELQKIMDTAEEVVNKLSLNKA